MGIHDWSGVSSGSFHHFHQGWSWVIAQRLNEGRLPDGFMAMVEQRAMPREADVLTVTTGVAGGDRSGGGVATMPMPKTRIIAETDNAFYARKANRIAVKHEFGHTVAVIEIVSPGNKNGRRSFREFVDKTFEYLRSEVSVLVIDLFPPSPRDPDGIHKAIWDEIAEVPFALPQGQDRVLVSYESVEPLAAHIETVGVGDVLPDMPLFLEPGWPIPVPLDASYAAAWEACPKQLRDAVTR